MAEKYILKYGNDKKYYPNEEINNAERFDKDDYNRLRTELSGYVFYKIEKSGKLTKMPMGR
jgi:hypothetical protein